MRPLVEQLSDNPRVGGLTPGPLNVWQHVELDILLLLLLNLVVRFTDIIFCRL